MHSQLEVENEENYKSKIYTKKELEELEAELKAIKNIILEVFINGTPTLFTKDGKKVRINMFLKKYTK
jgi:hypothetical protein